MSRISQLKNLDFYYMLMKNPISAYRPKQTLAARKYYVRYVPKADITSTEKNPAEAGLLGIRRRSLRAMKHVNRNQDDRLFTVVTVPMCRSLVRGNRISGVKDFHCSILKRD